MSYDLTPLSWFFANVAASTDLTGTSADITLADPITSGSIEGPDFSWDAAAPQTVTLLHDGLYQIYADAQFIQTPDADGNAVLAFANGVSWPSDAGSLLSWLYASGLFSARPSAATAGSPALRFGGPMTVPPVWASAGGTVTMQAYSQLVTGTVTLRSTSGLAIVRLA